MPKTKMGRPKAEVDENLFSRVIQCPMSKDWVIHAMGVSRSTLERWIKKKYGLTFDEIQKQKMALTKAKIIYKQIEVALQGNPAFLIWTGKVLCGQKEDKVVAPPQDAPVLRLSYDRNDIKEALKNELKKGGPDHEEETKEAKGQEVRNGGELAGTNGAIHS